MVISGFYPIIGGAEKQALNLSVALRNRGATIRVATAKVDDNLPDREVISGIEVHRVPVWRVKGMGEVSVAVGIAWQALRWRNKFDVLHVHIASYLAIVGLVVAKLLRKAIVVKLANVGQRGDMARIDRQFGQLGHWLLKKADCIICTTSDLQKELVDRGYPSEIIARIPNGILLPPTSRERVPLADRKQVVWTGMMRKRQKNLPALLRVWRRVVHAIPGFTLTLVGDGPLRAELEAICCDLDIKDHVQFVGLVSDVQPYLDAARVFVLPSLHEGLSNSLLEAMASGLPVVATRVSGCTDLIQSGYNGFLVDVNDEDAMTDSIVRLLKDASLASRLGENARKSIEKDYSIEVIAARYHELYTNMLECLSSKRRG